jgi:L-serine dehydratase
MIRVVGVDRYATDFSGELDTVIVWHHDWPGFLAKVTTLLACVEANIATIHTARKTRNTDALTVIEVDAPLPDDVVSVLNRIKGVNRVVQLRRSDGAAGNGAAG